MNFDQVKLTHTIKTNIGKVMAIVLPFVKCYLRFMNQTLFHENLRSKFDEKKL